MKDNQFTVKDLVLNQHFQAWVLKPNAQTEEYWQTWLKENPQHSELLAEARETILLLGFTDDGEANADFVEVWSEIRHDVKPSSNNSGLNWRVAAVFIGLLALVSGYFLRSSQTDTITYSSGYGEIKHIVLPDSSRATLNGNTQLYISKSGWNTTSDREVFLEGEAFFEVKHINNNGKANKFLVHTNELDVEVLGTEFSVTSRHQETQVVLNSGKVQLQIPQNSDTSKLIMSPGDLVVFNKQIGNAVVEQTKSPDQLNSWRRNQLVFDGTTLSEISDILKDTYGLEIKFSSESLRKKRFRGTFIADDIDILKEALTQTYEIQIVDSN